MTRTTPIQDLNKEHERLRSDVNDLQIAVRALQPAASDSWREQARTLRDQVEMFHRALLLHFRREQEGLFPDARSMVAEQGRRGDALSQFFAEEGEDDFSAHASLSTRSKEMLSLCGQMDRSESPEEQDVQRLRTLLSTTRSLLESHADKETKIIFPMIARALDDENMEQVARRMAELESASDLVNPSAGQDDAVRDLHIEQE